MFACAGAGAGAGTGGTGGGGAGTDAGAGAGDWWLSDAGSCVYFELRTPRGMSAAANGRSAGGMDDNAN